MGSSGFYANNSLGSSGQVLTSNGSSVYWSTVAAGVNTAAQFSWTNTHNFAANVTFNNSSVALRTRQFTSNATVNNSIVIDTSVTSGGVNSIRLNRSTSANGSLTVNNYVSSFGAHQWGEAASSDGLATGGYQLVAGAYTNGNGAPESTLLYLYHNDIIAGNFVSANLGVNATSASFSLVNLTSQLTANESNIRVGNTAVNAVINSTAISLAYDDGNDINLSNINATSLLISNSTITTTLDLTALRVGNTTTNVVISNTVSRFGGNVAISGVANVSGNVTLGSSAFFVGNGVNITTINATNITTGTLPMAQLGSNVVNTTAAFTISGIHTHTANVHMGNTTVNTQQSNAIIVINNSNVATLNASSIGFGNATVNSVYGLATVTINGATIANSTGANNAFNLGGVAAASYVNTSGAYTISGIHTHTANVHMGNTTVNTQQSNATILISNSTTTTTVGLTDIRLGNSTVNTFINASGLTTAANVLINATGELVISPGAGIFANGSLGTAGQVLSSNGTSVYWTTVATGGVRSVSITTASTITPTSDTADQYNVTALASSPATIAAPSGSPTNGQKLVIRLKDNGTGRTLSWTTTSGGYRAIGVTLPNTTVANKTTYVGCIYNATDLFWDVVASVTEA
jgi:hypothetical protein